MMGMYEHCNESLCNIKQIFSVLPLGPLLSEEGPFIMNLILSKIMKSGEEIHREQSLCVICNEKQVQQKEHTLFDVWCCTAMTNRRYDAFTELYKFREGYSGSIW
jgi:hypothetical protein